MYKLINRLFGRNDKNENLQDDDILNPAHMKPYGGYRIIMEDGSIEDFEAPTREEAVKIAKQQGRHPLGE